MSKEINKPGNLETTYENRKTGEVGKIISYQEKFKTLMMELNNGTTKTMTYSTFRGAWRIKATEDPIADTVTITEPVITEPIEQPELIKKAKAPSTKINGKSNKNIKFTINGESKTIAEWAKEYGMSASLVYCRIYRGKQDILTALTKPVRSHK